MSVPDPQVLVLGAGPVGLVCALQLAKAGIRVLLLEREPSVSPQAKATHFASPAVLELDKAGVLPQCREQGFEPKDVRWMDLQFNVLGETLFSAPGDDTRHNMVCIPQHILSAIMIEESKKYSNFEIKWNHAIVKLEQDDDKVTVTCDVTENGEVTQKTYTAPYAAGTDGGRSVVRKQIGQHLDGFTWEDQLVATNVHFDFHKYGLIDSNFIVDPEHVVMHAKIAEPDLWRVSYIEKTGLTNEELRERLLSKFNIFFPPASLPLKETDFKLTNFAPYKIHQRCVAKMRVGRVCLAGDSAHLVNPFGGTGLTSGMIDGGGLADCLIGIFEHGVDPEFILAKYGQERRRVWDEFTNVVSTANKQRLTQDPKVAMQTDEFLKFVATATLEEKTTALKGAWAMQYDFTQHYPKA